MSNLETEMINFTHLLLHLSGRLYLNTGRFMLLGAFGIFFSLLLFSNAENIAHIVHGKSLNSGNEQSNALFIAITGFWLLDAMTNTLQGPARSLLGDVIRPEEQLLGNACFSVANGLGKCIGYFLGSITTKIELIYGTAAAISLFLSLITIVTIHEQASDELQETAFVSPESERSGYSSSPKCPSDASEANVTATKFCVSAPMTRAFTVQCFTYFAWMILYVYGSDWVGKEVFNGDADAAPKSAGRKSFELGVMTANRGLLIMSLLSIPIGVLLPFLIRKVNVKVIWSLSLLLFSTMLVLCKVFISRYFVIIMFGLLSLPLAVSYTIPWTIAGLSVEKGAAGSRGTQLALFNLSQSLPGILAALVSGLVVRASGGDLGYVMSLGGCSALFACIAVIFTIIPDELARTRGVEFEQSISIRGNTV